MLLASPVSYHSFANFDSNEKLVDGAHFKSKMLLNRTDQEMSGVIGEKRLRVQRDDGSVGFMSRFLAPDTSVDQSFHTALDVQYDT